MSVVTSVPCARMLGSNFNSANAKYQQRRQQTQHGRGHPRAKMCKTEFDRHRSYKRILRSFRFVSTLKPRFWSAGTRSESPSGRCSGFTPKSPRVQYLPGKSVAAFVPRLRFTARLQRQLQRECREKNHHANRNPTKLPAYPVLAIIPPLVKQLFRCSSVARHDPSHTAQNASHKAGRWRGILADVITFCGSSSLNRTEGAWP